MESEIKCGIYKITNPIGRIYIGQSKDITKRWLQYQNYNCKNQIKLYNSLKKYGHINHKFEVIEECKINELNNLERYHQEENNVLDRKVGLNCMLANTDNEKSVLSNDSVDKIKKSLVEFNDSKIRLIYQYGLDGNLVKIWKNFNEIKNNTKYIINYVSRCCHKHIDKSYEYVWRFNEEVFSDEFLNRVKITKSEKLQGNSHNNGRVLTTKHKAKISNSVKGYKHKNLAKILIAKSKEKPILQYHKDGSFIKEWECATIAGKKLGVAPQNISKCCCEKIKTAYGFIWRFK